MKKLLLAFALIFSFPVIAEMIYNPIDNTVYTYPQTPEINQMEYFSLGIICVQIERRMTAMNNYILPPGKSVLNQFIYYLQQVGTPTAFRLIEDFKKNMIYYADGTPWVKIWFDF